MMDEQKPPNNHHKWMGATSICTTCGKRVRINAEGLLYPHRHNMIVDPSVFSEICLNSSVRESTLEFDFIVASDYYAWEFIC